MSRFREEISRCTEKKYGLGDRAGHGVHENSRNKTLENLKRIQLKARIESLSQVAKDLFPRKMKMEEK